MGHSTFKIKPGVEVNETPALNTAAISKCQAIRFKPDDNGLGLVEKLGGWASFLSASTPQPSEIVRQLLPWEDTNAQQWLGVGIDNSQQPATDALVVYSCAQQPSGLTTGSNYTDLTPIFETSDAVIGTSAFFTTVAGSATVTIEDTLTQGIAAGSMVYIATQVAVGGLVLFGMYL